MQPKFHLAREQTTNLYTAVVQNAVCDFHFHSHVELIIVLEGQIEVTINDQQRVLTCGELAIALSYDAHQFRALTQSRSLCVIIPTDMCPDFISAVSDQKNCNPFLQDASLFETVCSCFHRIQKAENSITKKGYVFVLLGTVLKHMQLEQKTDVTDPRLLTDILLYLSTHYTEDISLSSIAQDLGYNASYLSRCFLENFQIGIPGYITMLRLRQAILLMRDPAKRITDCAFESGFRSLRTFYRAFHEEFHCAPKAYRSNTCV